MRARRATLGRDAIRLNRAIADLPLQAKARFALPRGVTYELIYDHRQVHPSGNVTWSGYLKDHGDDYRAVITFGDQGTFGRIVTPDGEFLIESDAAGEWLVDPQTHGLTPAESYEDDARIPPVENRQLLLNRQMDRMVPLDGSAYDAQAGGTTPVDIDVMILYTPGLASRLGSGLTARLDQLVALSNQAYRDSGVYINLRLVHSQQVNYSDATTNDVALDALTDGADPALTDVASLRDTYGADLVSLIRPFNRSASGGSCGIAWVGGYNGQPISYSSEYGYSVIGDGRDVNGSGYYCLDLSFVHELGHNMGSLHDRANSSGGTGAYPYSYGYGVSGTFGTVMSYINPRIGKFSNPAITCAGGIACGISETAANSANNVLSLNNTRAAVAAFRGAQVVTPPAPSTYALTVAKAGSGTVSSSPAGINCGADCSESYAGGTSVTLTAVPAAGSTFAGWSGDCTGASTCQVTVSSAKNVVAIFTALTSPAKKPFSDFNGDGRADLAGVNSAGGIYYTTDLSHWNNIPGALSRLVAGDLNGDGRADLAGVNSAGGIYYTTDLSRWNNIPGALSRLVAGDLNGDGRADLAGVNSAGGIYYTTDLSHWNNIPGALSRLVAGDLNGDGRADLAGVNSAGGIYYTTDLSHWNNIPGALSRLVAGDLNGDGRADLAGVTSAGGIYYTTDLSRWNNIPGVLSRLVAGDLNGDGRAELAGVTSAGGIYYTTDLSRWNNIPGVLSRLVAGDLNGDGRAELAGVTSAGGIYYSPTLNGWVQVNGQLTGFYGEDFE
ncbi:MAG: hypothetical protein IPL51_15570 [Candidatus Competibacteraceae bacterium]|nr:hypothetical protein [Candidatus Competibacteraceae bacterium]